MTEDEKATDSTPKRIALIGSGPISLLKALLLSQSDPTLQITLYDEQNKVGGAWYSDKSPKGHEIESGCHIWSYAPEAYNYIESELGVKLDYMNPPPYFVGKNLKVPYGTKNTVESYKYIIKNIISIHWREITHIKQNPKYNFKLFGKRNKYPLKGSPELINALEKKINNQKNVSLIFNTKILEIEAHEKIILKTDNNTIEFDEVYITSVSNVSTISTDKGALKLNQKQIDYVHLLIQLDKPLKKKITYLRLMNDPIVHRITDITYQSEHEENLILVGIKENQFHSSTKDQLLDHTIKVMNNLNLIDDSFQANLINTHVFPTFYIDEKLRIEIANLNPKLHILHSTDLMHGIHYLINNNT